MANRVYIVNGRIYEETGERTVIVNGRILEETTSGATPPAAEIFNAAQRTDRGYGPQHALTLGGLLQ